MVYLAFGIRMSLAFICVAAVVGKLGSRRQYRGFRQFIRQIGVPDPLVGPAAAGVVTAEATVAVLLPSPATGPVAAALAAALFGAFTGGVQVARRRGRTPKCYCFGRLGQPLGRGHLARNGVLTAAGVAGCWLSAVTIWWPPSPAGGAVTAAAALVAAVLVVFWDDLAAVFDAEPVTAHPARADR